MAESAQLQRQIEELENRPVDRVRIVLEIIEDHDVDTVARRVRVQAFEISPESSHVSN